MVGLKGHRSVGGIRASIYNAVPLEWVRALVQVHERFPQGCVMAKVLVSDSLSKEGLEFLKQAQGIELENKPGLNEDELAKAIVGVEGLVIRSGSKVTAKVIEAADKLRVIGRAGIGVDNVDVKAASRRGIIVMNTPTGNAVTTAEHAHRSALLRRPEDSRRRRPP